MLEKRQLLCLNGDGISDEIMAATLAVFETVRPQLNRPVTIINEQVGFASLARSGTTITKDVIAAAASADGLILGPVSHNSYPPVAEGGLNPSGVLRKSLSLYANIRPAVSFDGLPRPTKHKYDLVVMRENLEGFYADRNMAEGPGEIMPVDGVALAFRRITRDASYNIAKAAFELAMKRQKKTVTAIHKANVMRLSDGLFLDTVRDVAKTYPQIAYDEMLVDAAAALLVRDPGRFDVLVTTNMFGDILSDLASELSGGLGLAGSLNAGHGHIMAQAQHGSAPDIAGQDKANPTSLILSLAMLLEQWEETKAAARINGALVTLLANAKTRTTDLGGMLTCSAFAALLCQHISGD